MTPSTAPSPITNTGSLPAAFSLTETTSKNGFSADALSLTITDTTVYSGDFGGVQLDATTVDQ